MKSIYKIAIICLLALMAHETKAQTLFPHDESGQIAYAETIKVDSVLTKNQLYSRANEFFAKAFVSANNVIQYQDKDEGKIVGKGNLKIRCDGNESLLKFTISIFVKDGKYRYLINDLSHDELINIEEKPKGLLKNHKANIQWNINYEMLRFSNEIKAFMSKPKSTDDW